MSEENQIEQQTEQQQTEQTITLEQFKNALENNSECKGYFDSLCDKTVSTRLNKGIESWKEKNLNNLIETEINKRYPQKSEAEIKFEEQQKQLEQVQAEKQQLQLQIKYHDLMAENNLPLEVLDFVTGKDIQTTISNIERFKKLVEDMVDKHSQEVIRKKLGESNYRPASASQFEGLSSNSSMWDI